METSLQKALGPWLAPRVSPAGQAYTTINEKGIAAVAVELGLSGRQVMDACLEQDIWPERFAANRGTLGREGQRRLLGSRAVVLGAGGLGGLAVLQLARAGVGALVVCDGDVFEESNLNRQMLCRLDRLGQAKARAAAQEVAAINPHLEIRAVTDWAGRENLPRMLAGAQVALDCLDNMATRYLLEEAAAASGVAYVHGAIAGLEGFVMTILPGEPGLKGLYGPIPVEKKNSAEAVLGTPTVTPAALATLQVNEAIKLLAGGRGLGPGQLLHLDLAAPSLEIIELAV